jgi:hypothetical protein
MSKARFQSRTLTIRNEYVYLESHDLEHWNPLSYLINSFCNFDAFVVSSLVSISNVNLWFLPLFYLYMRLFVASKRRKENEYIGNKVLSRILGLREGEVTRGWRKLDSGELFKLYFLHLCWSNRLTTHTRTQTHISVQLQNLLKLFRRK